MLKYRLAREPNSTYSVDDHALADTKRTIRLVRSRAQEWNIAPSRVGVIGFSAGGELAALAGMRFDSGNKDATDPVERENSRPDFQALIYPGSSGRISPPRDPRDRQPEHWGVLHTWAMNYKVPRKKG